MYNGGVLTDDAAKAVYEARLDEITRRSSASRPAGETIATIRTPIRRLIFWRQQRADFHILFRSHDHGRVRQFQSAGWLQSLVAPVFNNYGGEVASGFDVTITKPVGSPGGAEIYFTTDGSDPRLAGGAANPSATHGVGPFAVDIDARQADQGPHQERQRLEPA